MMSTLWPGAIVYVIYGIFVIITIIMVVYFNCANNARKAIEGAPLVSQLPSMEKFLQEVAKEKLVRFTAQQLCAFTSNYSTTLGSGGFGVVYKGQFPNGVKIAVKVLERSSARAVGDQFMAEEKETIEWEKLHEIAIGTAKGIAYLHEECQERIIHYEIKPANVLFDANFFPKVADFGLAKLCNRDFTYVSNTGYRGTLGYFVLEFFLKNHPITYKCDVYSVGMVLFEVIGRRRNTIMTSFESLDWFPKHVWEKYEKGELTKMTKTCEIEEKDRGKVERMSMVALWCVQDSPEVRPSMSAMVKMLEGGVDIMLPPKPFQSVLNWDEFTQATSAYNWFKFLLK